MAKKITLLLLLSVSLYSQHVNRTAIINSGEYYFGTGISRDVRESCDLALKELTSQIAVHVAHSFERVVTESSGALEDNVESILNTHAAATLRNVNTIKRSTNDGRIEAFCYLKKNEVEKIWEERKQLIADMVEKAHLYIVENNVSHALKLNYFAALLLNSLPDQNVDYKGVNYTTEIPKKVNEILLNTHFAYLGDSLISENEREVTLRMMYRKKPAAIVDFVFWDGANQVAVQGRDGMATFRLVGASVKFEELKLNIKTAYYENRKEYGIIETLWDLVKRPEFHAFKVVRLEKTEAHPAQLVLPEGPMFTSRDYKYNFDIAYEEGITVAKHVAQTIMLEASQLLEILEEGNLDDVASSYTYDPFLFEKISDYVTHNQPKPLDRNIGGVLNKTKSGWELRRIRMLHTYPTIHKQTTEYLVLDFDENGELIDLNTCISDGLYQKFVMQAEHGNDWGNRQEIIKFLEKYRTAYLTRDIKTVDMMFAEEAIIIVGRKLETRKLPENMVRYEPFGRQPGYDYIKLTKKEYLQRQRRIFQSVEDIFLDFSTFNIVRKNSHPSIYGVEMRQTYLSTNYGDEGYLFLLIDFDPDTLADNPLIYVRAWQPNAWSREEIIRTGHFIVHR